MNANLFVVPCGMGFSIVQLKGSNSGQQFPGLILYYGEELGRQITKKVLPLVNEDNVLVCVIKKPDGDTEISLLFVVDCPNLIEIDISSIFNELIPGKKLTERMCDEAKKERKFSVSRIVSGMEYSFSKEKTDELLRLEEKEGCFLVALGIYHGGKSFSYPDWCIRKDENKVFRTKEEFWWVASVLCGLEADFWKA